ncbi:hypothetical protein COLO4_08970 [Corchorus olitorius]|uniref:Uncharacterized protein n=1 Tax=Corchorus olitorius TaxID=93759 RepID=A0A1R3KDT9_9ROSI|nr:hypothetical protein COLO4_08970 [Corchorus olitorius]
MSVSQVRPLYGHIGATVLDCALGCGMFSGDW